jgi:release factor glutamine methyltransferase
VEGGATCPDLEVWATDASADALAVARANVGALRRLDREAAGRVQLAPGSWFDALPARLAGRVDLLVSNPPYVTESEYPDLDPSVREWEPREALVAADGAQGTAGMAAIEAIVLGAPRWLRPSGALVIEIAPAQAGPTAAAAREAGFGRVITERDLAGRLRMVVAGW